MRFLDPMRRAWDWERERKRRSERVRERNKTEQGQRNPVREHIQKFHHNTSVNRKGFERRCE